MTMQRDRACCYCFADLRLDAGQRRVWRGATSIDLPKLSFDALLTLVANAPNVVSHTELAALVWGDARIVTPENIAQRIMVLRRRLGDSSADPHYIKGVRGFGYQLIPEVAATIRTNGAPRPSPSSSARPAVSVTRIAGRLVIELEEFA